MTGEEELSTVAFEITFDRRLEPARDLAAAALAVERALLALPIRPRAVVRLRRQTSGVWTGPETEPVIDLREHAPVSSPAMRGPSTDDRTPKRENGF